MEVVFMSVVPTTVREARLETVPVKIALLVVVEFPIETLFAEPVKVLRKVTVSVPESKVRFCEPVETAPV